MNYLLETIQDSNFIYKIKKTRILALGGCYVQMNNVDAYQDDNENYTSHFITKKDCYVAVVIFVAIFYATMRQNQDVFAGYDPSLLTIVFDLLFVLLIVIFFKETTLLHEKLHIWGYSFYLEKDGYYINNNYAGIKKPIPLSVFVFALLLPLIIPAIMLIVGYFDPFWFVFSFAFLAGSIGDILAVLYLVLYAGFDSRKWREMVLTEEPYLCCKIHKTQQPREGFSFLRMIFEK